MERWQEARASLEALVAEAPHSPLAAEASYLAHRAWFRQALAIADIESPTSDEEAAAALLEALSREPWDYAVGAADLARAVTLGKAGSMEQAEALTRETLEAWRTYQRAHRPRPPQQAGLHAEVVAIRDLVFRPYGGAIYDDERARWNAFDWPQAPLPFLVVDPDFSVKLPSGEVTRVSVYEEVPGLDNVLFMSAEHRGFLAEIISHLGGTKTRAPRAIMETPNQPIGPSLDILALWGEFFPVRQGHWFGWVFETYPIIHEIELLNEERTEAVARVTIGYSGASVVLEKRDGAWSVVRLTDFWIT
jgi:hypothetical protein